MQVGAIFQLALSLHWLSQGKEKPFQGKSYADGHDSEGFFVDRKSVFTAPVKAFVN